MRVEFLSAMACVLLAVPAAAGTHDVPQKVSATLCDTEEQAISLASQLSAGQSEPFAINAVNKATGAEVCGRFVGYAVKEIEKTQNRGGTLFMLAGLRFSEDDRLAWTASWIVPFDSSDLERGT